MLSPIIEEALNNQIAVEAQSSQVYLSMASWAEVLGFEGVAQFMYAHSDEERMHMLKMVKFVNERGGHAKVSALEAPPKEGFPFPCNIISVSCNSANTLKVSFVISALAYIEFVLPKLAVCISI